MPKTKVALTIDTALLERVDSLVSVAVSKPKPGD
jgi:hypothetical protein